jgi:hypothetical protein
MVPETSLISPSQYPLMHVPEGPEGELLLKTLFFFWRRGKKNKN